MLEIGDAMLEIDDVILDIDDVILNIATELPECVQGYARIEYKVTDSSGLWHQNCNKA